MFRITLLPLLMVATSALADEPLQSPAMAGLANVAFPAPNIITAGRLQATDITTLANAGVRHVIDLTTEAESQDFDEAWAVQQAGLQYHRLPISGGGDLTQENVTRLDHLLREIGSDVVLVHCASSNRVGALAALRAGWLQGLSDEAAIVEGKRWGLAGLEPAVRERLLARDAAKRAEPPLP
ncbi:MAG: phosphatase domain-containing protein [Pseudomarimonas sp.]